MQNELLSPTIDDPSDEDDLAPLKFNDNLNLLLNYNDLLTFGPTKIIEKSIGDKIQKIIIEVYNSHIDNDVDEKEDSDFFMPNCEIHLDQTFNDFPNFLILKVLTDKIKLAVNAYKEKILAVKEISGVFQRYIKSKDPFRVKPNVINDFTGFELLKLPEIHIAEDTNQRMTVIKVLLLLLKTIKKILLNSSEDFERIFKYPLSLLVKDKDKVEVDFKKIHIKEFRTFILLDDFIQKMLMSIKIKSIGLTEETEITEMMSYIDEREEKGVKEKESMTIYLMNKLSEIHEEKFLQRDQDKELKVLAEKRRAFIQKKAKFENMKLARKRHSNIEEEETKNLDIDELVNYISENGSKGKKNKKKKNKKNKNNSTDANSTYISEGENEISRIKAEFVKDSCKKYLIRKIIPYISQEWIKKYQ